MRRSNKYPVLPTDRKRAHEWELTDHVQIGTGDVFSRKVQDIRVWKCQKCGHIKSVNRKPSKYEKIWVALRPDSLDKTNRLFCDDYTVFKVMET